MLLKIFRGISNYNIHRKLRNRYEAKLDWELMTLVNSGLTWLIMWLLTQLLSTKHSPGWGVLFPRWPDTNTITHRSHLFEVDTTSVHLYICTLTEVLCSVSLDISRKLAVNISDKGWPLPVSESSYTNLSWTHRQQSTQSLIFQMQITLVRDFSLVWYLHAGRNL